MSENSFSLGTVVEDAKKVITNPADFYRQMPTTGGYADPLIFVVVMAAATGLLMSVLSLIGLGGGNAMMAGGMALAAVFVFPIFAVIGSFIGAAVIFVIWKLMGSEKNYEVAYRCAAYTAAILPIVTLLSIIPYIGTIIRTLWGSFLLYVASTEVHQLKEQTAKIVFGILAAIGVLFGISGEHASRNMQASFDRATEGLPRAMKDLENMSAEETGEAVGDFLKGLEKAAREAKEEAEKD